MHDLGCFLNPPMVDERQGVQGRHVGACTAYYGRNRLGSRTFTSLYELLQSLFDAFRLSLELSPSLSAPRSRLKASALCERGMIFVHVAQQLLHHLRRALRSEPPQASL